MDYFIGALYSLTVSILGGIILQVLRDNKRLRKDRKENNMEREKSLGDGVVCLLRIQLIEYHTKYMPLGRIPTYAYESFDLMYKAYKALGGNGTITHMREDIEELEVTNQKRETL
ncbi:hypothetical protein [Blautia producta]|uniref:hypothetical protein n=1 Tax=Blautia producta TaxID=33035 RepID=UPI0031B609BF